MRGGVVGVPGCGHVRGRRGHVGAVAEPGGQGNPDHVVGSVADDDCELAARIADLCGGGVDRYRGQELSVIDLDDFDCQSVGPAVVLGECCRSSAHCGGAIGWGGAGAAVLVGPSVQFDSRMVVMSQIKIFSPQICLDSWIVGSRAG